LIGDCRANKILPPRSWNHISDSSHIIHTDLGLRSCWNHSAFLGAPKWNDMARHTRFYCYVLKSSQTRKQTCRWMDNISLQILPLRLPRISRFLFPTRSLVSCFKLVQRCHMVCTEECCDCQSCRYFSPLIRTPLTRSSLALHLVSDSSR
jgi:hypothetical protein